VAFNSEDTAYLERYKGVVNASEDFTKLKETFHGNGSARNEQNIRIYCALKIVVMKAFTVFSRLCVAVPSDMGKCGDMGFPGIKALALACRLKIERIDALTSTQCTQSRGAEDLLRDADALLFSAPKGKRGNPTHSLPRTTPDENDDSDSISIAMTVRRAFSSRITSSDLEKRKIAYDQERQKACIQSLISPSLPFGNAFLLLERSKYCEITGMSSLIKLPFALASAECAGDFIDEKFDSHALAVEIFRKMRNSAD
jgi:hypothetical protein